MKGALEMSKRLLLAATLLLLETSHPAGAQNLDWDKIEIYTQKIAPNFYRAPRKMATSVESCESDL
jgi:hypothetical protein